MSMNIRDNMSMKGHNMSMSIRVMSMNIRVQHEHDKSTS